MSEQFIQGIVRILHNDGVLAGTGFVVSESGLIATCSHVIQHTKLQDLGEPRPEKVRVIFHLTGDELDARVEPDWWLPWNAGDLAVLRIDGILPAGVQPLLLGSSEGTGGHDISTFGFPKVGSIIEGIGADGRIVRSLPRPNQDWSLLQLSSSEITEGFSGAPIWDKLTRRVIGVVSFIANPDSRHRLGETAFAVSTETLQKRCPLLQISDEPPYFGLAAFEEKDTEFFFGRQVVINRILNRLSRYPSFLAILGPSGSGKSSIVQAGFIPQLKKGGVPGSDRWGVLLTRPAGDPFVELGGQESVVETPHLREHVENWLHQHPQQERLVLVFDQFEELFAPGSEALCQSLIEQIIQLFQSSLPISVILVMRNDFYSRIAQYETLMAEIEKSQVNIPELTEEDRKAIIRRPAEAVGLRFEEGLVERLVKDTSEASLEAEDGGPAGQSTVLPLLESALTELWKRRKDGMLTHEAYKSIGGVAGALNQWADQAVLELISEGSEQLVRRLFTDLVYLGDMRQGVPDNRRRRSLSSLYHQDHEQHKIQHIVEHLTDDRHPILVTGLDVQTDEATVEIIHDVLLQKWERLKQWIENDRAFLTWHQEIEHTAQVWSKQQNKNKNKLLRGRDLREARKWMKERQTDLGQAEIAFLRASVKYSVNLVVRLLAMVFLILSLTGATGWYYVHQTPDPTRVTNLNDDGPGSLRYCINNIQSGTITFAQGLKGIIKLTSGEIIIKGKLTIDGPGSDVLAVNSKDGNSAIFISLGASVTISGLSFQDSRFNGVSFLNNSGTLSIVNSTLSNNWVVSVAGGVNSGGAIENNGVLSIRDSNIINNSAINPVFNGTARNQIGGGFGGGIYNLESGTVTVMNSTIAGNSANVGGGIASNTGNVIVINSTISGNDAAVEGGGIDTTGPLTLINSTLANNTVGGPSSQVVYGPGSGGGIHASYHQTGPEPLMLAFDTIYGNTSSGTSGAIENDADVLTIKDSILVGNTTSSGSDIAGQAPLRALGDPVQGLVTTEGYNLFQNVDEVSIVDPNGLGNTDLIVTPEDLSTIFGPHPQLQNNGAATKTYALLPIPNNPAIGKIPLDSCHIPEILNKQTHQYTDQRSTPRPNGKERLCDIGAYEAGVPPIAQSPAATATPPANACVGGIGIGGNSNKPAQALPATTTGPITEFALSTLGCPPEGITAGPDGNLWFTEPYGNDIGRITPVSTIIQFAIPTDNSDPERIVAGPDGDLWFTELDGEQIGRITPTGKITNFMLSVPDDRPVDITKGPDGNLWFTNTSQNGIGRITAGK